MPGKRPPDNGAPSIVPPIDGDIELILGVAYTSQNIGIGFVVHDFFEARIGKLDGNAPVLLEDDIGPAAIDECPTGQGDDGQNDTGQYDLDQRRAATRRVPRAGSDLETRNSDRLSESRHTEV